MRTPNDTERLSALDHRIAKAKAVLDPPKAAQDHHSMAQIGWRMVIELVAGLGIGAAMGYGLDVLFGTLPVFLVVMTLLGFAAGVKTIIRSANEIQSGTTDSDRGPPGAREEDKSRGQ